MVIEPPHTNSRGKALFWLLTIMACAFFSRAIFLWWTRPEFMGWFNHAPWYWVQTRGLLSEGQLPFGDLPLLFHIYAALSRLLMSMGLEMDSAIINAQRLVMCATPALLVVPCWWVIRKLHDQHPLGWAGWLLVVLAAFLPLTFAHMPELLQKNMLGLMLLATLMAASYAALDRPAWGFFGLLVFALITLTHLGTLATAALWILAMTIAVALTSNKKRRPLAWLAIALACLALAFVLWPLFDPDTTDRIRVFILEGWRRSLAGSLFSPSPMLHPGLVLALLALMAGLLGALFYAWFRGAAGRHGHHGTFWLANLIFIALLVLPTYDHEVAVRFILYLPLPLLFVLAFQLRRGRPPWVGRTLTLLAAAAMLLLTVGEVANLFRPVPDKTQVQSQLAALKQREQLTDQDLIIAPYAVAPVANWFLGTDSTLVTHFQRSDFDNYHRVAVLNSGRELPAGDGDMESVRTTAERYAAMRQAVPLPPGLSPDPAFDQFRYIPLEEIPATWRFDAAGRWAGTQAVTSMD